MSTGLQLLGPIATGEDFMFVANVYSNPVNQPYVLILGSYEQDTTQYVQVDIVNFTENKILGTAGVFTASGTETAMTFYDIINKCWLGVSGNFLVSSQTETNFNLAQSNTPFYQPWDDPNIFLGNVTYSINVAGTGPASTYNIGNNGGVSSSVFQSQILPSSFYYSSACNISNSMEKTLMTWACSINNDTNVGFTCGSAVTGISMGYTNLSDCKSGIEYLYCLSGDYCGTNNCNGPCQNSATCNLSGSNYACATSPDSTKKFWESGAFIGIISAVCVIIIIVVIVFIIHHKKKESEENS